MAVILSMIQEAYTTDEINTKLVNSNFKEVSKLYISFANLYKGLYDCDLEETINQLDDFTADQKKNYRAVAKEFLGLNGFVFAADTLDTFLDLCEVCEKLLEYIKKLLEYCSLYNASVEWKECLQLMYDKAPKSNIPLRSALDSLLTASEGWDGIVFQIWRDAAADIGNETYKLLVGTLISAIADACPLIKGMRLGVSIGKGISNLLFSVDKTIEEYYVVCAFCEVEDLFKSVFHDVTVQYKNNKNSSNAEKFLKYLEMYFKVLNTGNDFGTDFGKQLCDGSIASKIAYSKEKYESFLKTADKMSKQTKEAYERIIRLWLTSLYDEDPEQYEIYAVEFGDPEKNYLPVSSVRFEQDSVEWGVKDFVFKGYHAQAYPENATCCDLVYTTSNKNVAEITSNGYLEVRGVGKCTITAVAVSDSSIFDTLEVTVIDQNGADSTAIVTIFPDTAPKPAVPKFDYSVNSDGTITLDKYRGTAAAVVIPEAIDWVIVSAIGYECFGRFSYTNIELTSAIIPNSVIHIGSRAFCGCTNLTSLTIPDSVTSIEKEAFSNCTNLASVTLPNSVTSIGEDVFASCKSLTSVMIPNSVTSIESGAFESCTSLTSVTIPNSITSIGNYAFFRCTNLTTVMIPNSVTSIGGQAFEHCTSLISVTIGNGITEIGGDAFKNCTNLTSITISNSAKNVTIHVGIGGISRVVLLQILTAYPLEIHPPGSQ